MKVNGKKYPIYDGKKCSKPPTIYIYIYIILSKNIALWVEEYLYLHY